MGLVSDIDQARSNTQQLQSTLKDAQVRQQTYLALREELASRDVLDRQYLRILPVKSEIPAFLGDLDRLAELSGLRVEQVQPQPEGKEEFFVKIPVSLVLSGKYHQLAKFFYNVSLLERAVNMENVALTKPQQIGEDIILQVNVLATTFRREEK
jgi:type IV pilus assembly protein PilO